jgi:hypothetical protein
MFYGLGNVVGNDGNGIVVPYSFGPADSLAPQPITLTGFRNGIYTTGSGITIQHVVASICRVGVLINDPDVTLNYCTVANCFLYGVYTGPRSRIYNSVMANAGLPGGRPIYSADPSAYFNYTDAYGGQGLGDPFGGSQLGNQNSSFNPFFVSAPYNYDLDPVSLFTNFSVSGGKIGAYGPGAILPTPVLGASVVDSEGAGGVVRVRWFADTRGSSRAGIFRRTEEASWEPLTVLYPDGQGYVTLEDRDVQVGALYGYGVGVQRDGHVGIEGVVWVRVVAPISGLAIRNVAPNPATTAWSIGFDSPETSAASIEAIDLSGRVVRTVQLGALTSGRQSVSLPARGLPPGVYWIRVREGNRSAFVRAVKSNR